MEEHCHITTKHPYTQQIQQNYAALLQAMNRDEGAAQTALDDEHNAAEAEQREEQP